MKQEKFIRLVLVTVEIFFFLGTAFHYSLKHAQVRNKCVKLKLL